VCVHIVKTFDFTSSASIYYAVKLESWKSYRFQRHLLKRNLRLYLASHVRRKSIISVNWSNGWLHGRLTADCHLMKLSTSGANASASLCL